MDESKVAQGGRSSSRTWIAVGLVVLAVGAAAAALLLRGAPPAPLSEAQAEVGGKVAASQEPADLAALPSSRGAAAPRVDSDGRVREAWAQVLGTGPLWEWISGGDSARRMAAVLMGLSQGELPRALKGPLAPPPGGFEVEERDGRLYPTARAFSRHAVLAGAAAYVDPGAAAAAFVAVEPLVERAWKEIAPRHQSLRQGLSRAVAHLLATPIPQDPELVEMGALYAYADPALEALSPAQKQLLRLGPDNARALQSQLRELREALGLPAAVR